MNKDDDSAALLICHWNTQESGIYSKQNQMSMEAYDFGSLHNKKPLNVPT